MGLSSRWDYEVEVSTESVIVDEDDIQINYHAKTSIESESERIIQLFSYKSACRPVF